jgi:hypothetical protein
MSDELFNVPVNDHNSDDQLWLAGVLQHAAAAERPSFSEELHARIMNAVRSGQSPRTLAAVCTTAIEVSGPTADERFVATPAVEVPSAPRPKRRVAKSWLAAAVALLLLAGGAWRLSSLGPSGGAPSNPPGQETPSGSTYTWADLDHDAKLSSQLVADQAPFEAPVEELALSSSK